MKIPEISSEEWEKFIEFSYDGVVIADSEGKIVYMNPASERLEEMDKDEIIGEYAQDLQDRGIYEVSSTVKVLKERRTVTVMQKKGGKQLVLTGIPIFQGDKIKWVITNERDVTELNILKRELEKLKAKTSAHEILIAEGEEMRKIMSTLERVTTLDISVLIGGASGTGKGVIAKWIHENSLRKDGPFVTIDSGSLPENLLESELFGYEKGAFTGARNEGKKGLVEAAAGGTLFFDEIGELPLMLQVKLLRLLQDQIYVPVGSVEEKKADIRIIAATNKKLEEMVKKGTFREDLFYRLNVIPIVLPPLCRRGTDVFKLVKHYLDYYNEKYGQTKTLEKEAVKALCNYSWPGNVRELSNAIERLVVITNTPAITIDDVADAIGIEGNQFNRTTTLPYKKALEEFEKEYIRTAARTVKTVSQLAKVLGVSLSTAKRKLKHYNIKVGEAGHKEGHT